MGHTSYLSATTKMGYCLPINNISYPPCKLALQNLNHFFEIKYRIEYCDHVYDTNHFQKNRDYYNTDIYCKFFVKTDATKTCK